MGLENLSGGTAIERGAKRPEVLGDKDGKGRERLSFLIDDVELQHVESERVDACVGAKIAIK